jgi:hypothetical protein
MPSRHTNCIDARMIRLPNSCSQNQHNAYSLMAARQLLYLHATASLRVLIRRIALPAPAATAAAAMPMPAAAATGLQAVPMCTPPGVHSSSPHRLTLPECATASWCSCCCTCSGLYPSRPHLSCTDTALTTNQRRPASNYRLPLAAAAASTCPSTLSNAAAEGARPHVHATAASAAVAWWRGPAAGAIAKTDIVSLQPC